MTRQNDATLVPNQVLKQIKIFGLTPDVFTRIDLALSIRTPGLNLEVKIVNELECHFRQLAFRVTNFVRPTQEQKEQKQGKLLLVDGN